MMIELQDHNTFFQFLKGIDKNKETYKFVQSFFDIKEDLKKVHFNSIRYIENEDTREFVLFYEDKHLVVESPFFYDEV